MVRLGDTTDHGGRVIEATNELKHSGIGVELFGHLVMCPKCGGPFPLLATGPRTRRGRLVGYGRSARRRTTCTSRTALRRSRRRGGRRCFAMAKLYRSTSMNLKTLGFRFQMFDCCFIRGTR
ncbi:PAAR domain-containing protein [Burkholderia pyrrocinia]